MYILLFYNFCQQNSLFEDIFFSAHIIEKMQELVKVHD